MRSQVAAIVGNLALVAPSAVLLISTVLWYTLGPPDDRCHHASTSCMTSRC